MKIKSLLAVIAITALQFVGYAQNDVTPSAQSSAQFVSPTNIPLSDLGKLWQYALTQVGQVGGQVYGQSVSGNPYAFVPYTNSDADPNLMAATVAANRLVFSSDVTEKLNSYVEYDSRLYSNAGGYSTRYTLFYGGTNFMLVKQANGVWAMPTNALKVPMDMNDWIPFPINGIQSAVIETTDANGNVTGYYNFADDYRIDTGTGVLLLGRKHLGLTGNMYIGLVDGSKYTYDLGSGNRHETAAVQATLDSSMMKNVRSLPDDTKAVSFQDGDVIVRVHYLTAGTVQVAFPSGLSQYPSRVCVVDTKVLEQNPFGDGLVFNPVNQPVTFTVQAGQTMFIRFAYAPSNQPLNNDGGYGMGAVEKP